MSDETVKVKTGRFVPPWIRSLPFNKTVTEDHTIKVGEEEFPLANDSIDPNTEVKIKRSEGGVVAKPVSVVEREKQERKERKKLAKKTRERARIREKRLKREKRANFWSEYDIPVKFRVQDNIRIGELKKGSSGTGRAKNTVDHFVVRESFSEGRLSREKGEFLCKNEGEWAHLHDPKEPITDPDETTPVVTCKTCLKRMERWKNED